ncbi:unnamed protein product [Prorocentrum cordatum]|uniref:Uncharacterized protein n=1 Tax=Prorocentrum cordatum TaxID=2364126 RepID=A0ABN9QBG2_9DINO|nr:unnamed protein product [Polarella glacialis]
MANSSALAGALGQLASTLSSSPAATGNPEAAAQLAQMLSGLAGAGGGGGCGGALAAQAPGQQAPCGPVPSVEEFTAQNGLEAWCAEALHLLDDQQRERVMGTPFNLEHTRNLDGVLTSRIKEVASTEQRLSMFVKINGLDPGVVDRLSTLTPEQHEKVMESTLKIAKANNPSGVCMKRITDVLRSERLGVDHGKHMSAPDYQPGRPSRFDQGPGGCAPADGLGGCGAPGPGGCGALGGGQPQNGVAAALANLVGLLNGSAGRDRSRSPPRGAPGGGGHLPRNIEAFVSENGLEWWVGEVLSRCSLLQRQNVMTELGNMSGIRNPSGVVMARVRQTVSTQEMVAIFIDINQLDSSVAAELWALPEEQQQAVMGPGIFIQAARNPSTIARTRMRNVLDGRDAMGGPPRSAPPGGGPLPLEGGGSGPAGAGGVFF